MHGRDRRRLESVEVRDQNKASAAVRTLAGRARSDGSSVGGESSGSCEVGRSPRLRVLRCRRRTGQANLASAGSYLEIVCLVSHATTMEAWLRTSLDTQASAKRCMWIWNGDARSFDLADCGGGLSPRDVDACVV